MANPDAALHPPIEPARGPSAGMTYARSRLLLGVSGVGTWVVLAALALVADAPARLATEVSGGAGAQVGTVVALAVLVALLQAPFDLLGGYLLPKRHGRTTHSLARYIATWFRAVLVFTALYASVGLALLAASSLAGGIGMTLLAIGASLLLLSFRTGLARLVGAHGHASSPDTIRADVRVLASHDIGFTGGVEGLFRPRAHIIPEHWLRALDADTRALALRRRRAGVASGLWLRGRLGALAFTWVGFAIAGAVASPYPGAAGAVLAFGAAFTLWSFLGLLVLPTLSRRASHAIDARVVGEGVDAQSLAELAATLDRLQDDEPERPGWIEAVFHPIPSVRSRRADADPPALAAWDIARTSAFLGVAGLSPLGRAVHCNSGRPALWVYLPLD